MDAIKNVDRVGVNEFFGVAAIVEFIITHGFKAS